MRNEERAPVEGEPMPWLPEDFAPALSETELVAVPVWRSAACNNAIRPITDLQRADSALGPIGMIRAEIDADLTASRLPDRR